MTTPADKTSTAVRCSADVWSRTGWPRAYQCERKAVETVNGVGFCKQHSPTSRKTEEARRRLSAAQDDFKRSVKRRGPVYFEALLKIAQGHNDPRALARETIKDIVEEE